ncbi:3-(methylthio)propionyl-CoA ligase [Chitinivorax sp. PXF-14]|uniref:3-(methylthio)propionyl-CoA ligase n=1 Tax=Chitinivorax sp. PXF-14 TaxID=3230488 RepID=UPI0034679748
MLTGLMMHAPLQISALIQHAERWHGDTEIVSRRTEGDIHRYTWRDAHRRTRLLANALKRLGCQAGDRIGTLAWNGYRHLEIYFATSGSELVCHTINPRLFPEQIAYIVNHAQDQYLFFDITFLPLLEALAPQLGGVKAFVAMTDRDHLPDSSLPRLLCYETLLEAEDDQFEWPSFDENTASSLCYTSGTTGNPKGVLYSHRSTLLHSLAIALPDALDLSARDCVLPVVPMFHVNAWGIPYAAPMTGCKLVFPGPKLDGASLTELFEQEGVTVTAGVPTVWLALLQHWKQTDYRPSTLNRVVIGGAAPPESMVRSFVQDYGCHVLHAWGMSEMSPVGTVYAPKFKHKDATQEQLLPLQLKQGRPVFGVDMRIIDANNTPLPHDGVAFGDLQVRGPWICSQYYERERGAEHSDDGWFSTGDVATIDSDGYMQITDRSKDVIKSGGEWISSIALENIMMSHPAVAEAAAIGIRHPKWDERPILVIVRKNGQSLSREEALAWFEGKIAKWWMPNDIVFLDELPHTATGKVQKLKLRERFHDYVLPDA